MGLLRVSLLGLPEVRHAGEVVGFPTRKALALLTYLAAEGGLHRRKDLGLLLWPDSDAERGRASLRLALVQVRAALGEATGGAERSHLQIARDTIGIDPAAGFDLDLHRLRDAYALARTSPGGERSPDTFARLAAAGDAYRGDFLAGFSLSDAPDFDDWATAQRERARREIGVVLDRLSRLRAEGGDLAPAIEAARRWVAHDPLDERAHRRLMRLHLAADDRAAALRAFEACRAILDRELGIAPSPETLALAERGRVAALPRAQGRRAEAVASPAATFPDPPLVGREEQHARLVAQYHAAGRHGARAVALAGEAGIGKSRLAAEFLAWAGAQGGELLQGRAFEAGGRLPYGPLVDALRARLERDAAPLAGLGEGWLAELSRLLPELRERRPDLPPPVADEGAARGRLFEAVARLGEALAAGPSAPLVLFVDDLQWADAATLDLLHYLARRWTERAVPALLLLALRSEDLAPLPGGPATGAPPLAEWLAGLGRVAPLDRLGLEPLGSADTARLVRLLLPAAGEAATAQFGGWLFVETGGQPFYLTETLKVLLERGALAARRGPDGAWAIDLDRDPATALAVPFPLPAGVRETIRARLAQLTPAAFALLVAGAVLGRRFDFEGVRRVADLPEETALPALDDLLRVRLLREVPDAGAAPYLFAHDKVRDVVYTEAGDARRRIFHRRALAYWEAVGAAPAELAHHALAAGQREAGYRHSLAAGDAALRLFAARDAIGHYERAREIAPSPQTAAGAEVRHLHLQLGRAYELSGDIRQARTVYEAMLGHARALGETAMESAALNRLATVAAQISWESAEPLAILHEARLVAERGGDLADLAETEWNLTQVSWYRWDIPAALAHGARAVALARQLGQPEPIARSLNALCYALMGDGDWADIAAHAEEARGFYAALGNRAMEGDCLALIAAARIRSGAPREGIAAARQGLAASRAIENSWGLANSAKELALGLLEVGEYAEARAVAEAGVAAARAIDNQPLLIFNLAVLGALWRALGDHAAAVAAHLEARAVNDQMRFPLFFELIPAELCADHAASGAWPEALRHAELALAARNYTSPYVGYAQLEETEALLRGGQVDRATEEVRRFGDRSRANRRYRVPYLRATALLARWRGDHPQASAHLREAATLASEIGLPGEQWRIAADLGELLAAQGDTTAARREIAAATAIVQRLTAALTDEALRATFLAAPPVRRLLP